MLFIGCPYPPPAPSLCTLLRAFRVRYRCDLVGKAIQIESSSGASRGAGDFACPRAVAISSVLSERASPTRLVSRGWWPWNVILGPRRTIALVSSQSLHCRSCARRRSARCRGCFASPTGAISSARPSRSCRLQARVGQRAPVRTWYVSIGFNATLYMVRVYRLSRSHEC